MRRCVIVILAIVCALAVYAQKSKKVTAEYTYYAPETMSIDEAKRVALERAKIQAIADEFGTTVSQSNSTIVSNRNGESDTQFLSIGGSDVKGEWIETLDEPQYDVKIEEHFIVVSVTVKGVIREITEAKTEIVAKTLRNGTTLRYEATEFRDGDDLYVSFRTPADGYLTIYLLDEANQTVYCMLPYSRSDGEPVPVEHDRDYIFFSDDHKLSKEQEVDEYTLTCAAEKEYNVLYVIFCPRKITKGMLSAGEDETIPNHLSFVDFKKWMAGLRKQFNDLTCVEIPITIQSVQ